jgi:hypothetical protein
VEAEVLFKRETLDGIESGAITLAFRRWPRARVRPGSRVRSARGVVEITRIERAARIPSRDARAAGYPSAAALRAELSRYGDGPLWRIGLRWGGPDPRAALRKERATGTELAALRQRLERLDRRGAWTARALALIAAKPGVVSTELARELGLPRFELKRRVRKLKELGLTESLEVGYRVSPRGRALLRSQVAE